ncbi:MULTISPECIES: glycosyltransferase family 2 protein [unclassified Acinetobacter]|uniref:glycosyltransferase family 2 protein n=1 Tax=unclassified Acinetobacter TaxID=196816 RepID=UPI0015D1DE79|nr:MULTISPECIES: glycosyltransferase family 2 protein [unclassified Acinetobacter]
MISVILTHYNKGLLLNRTIDSLQPEDENLHEIIVVDDCSTDPEWPTNYQYLLTNYPKVKIIQNTNNKGPAVRLNQGAFTAAGDYLFFMDSDDILAPDRLNMFLQEMQKQQADLCYAEKVKIHDVNEIQKHTTGIWESSTTPLSYVLENNIMQMCVMCTRELFLKSRGCNENIFIQDESLALNLAKYSKKIISSGLHSVFVILDEAETKSIRGENRLSRHLEQQHHDMFFTIDDFIQDYPDITEQNKKLLIKKAISTYWKSIRHTPQKNFTDFLIYLAAHIDPIQTWDKHHMKLTSYFNQLNHVRKINSRESN